MVEEASANLNKIIKQPDDSSREERKKKGHVRHVVEPQAPYDRCQAELFALQTSADTYLQDPSDQGMIIGCVCLENRKTATTFI